MADDADRQLPDWSLIEFLDSSPQRKALKCFGTRDRRAFTVDGAKHSRVPIAKIASPLLLTFSVENLRHRVVGTINASQRCRIVAVQDGTV